MRIAVVVLLTLGLAQSRAPNYDESRVPDYDLPDPLVIAICQRWVEGYDHGNSLLCAVVSGRVDGN